MDKNVSEVKFNFGKVTAKFMTQFFKANKENDYEAMAAIFADVVTECPASWGDPTKTDTFHNLPMFPVFRDLIKHFVDTLADESKK